MMAHKIQEECGVFGVYNNPDAANLTYSGLYALQHRGQESSGIVVSDASRLNRYVGMGLVNQVFRHPDILNSLQGCHSIGHNRYSTTGSSSLTNSQPILIDFKVGQLASAHNGNLVNAISLRKEMEEDGSIFTSTTDTEVIMHLVARSKRSNLDEMILEAMSHIKGAYSILFLTKDALYGARDPRGIRPLLLGELNGSYFLSSETCAFDLIGINVIREIECGEMVRIKNNKVVSYSIPQFQPVERKAHCIFEYIYFSRPDSFVFGANVDKIRRKIGKQLAREYPVPDADFVMGVPDSSTTAALGYAQETKIKYDIGLIRNHYVGRTFIIPEQSGRDFGVRIKFNPVKGVIKNKKIVIVDDSLVRGTTMKKIIQLIKQAEPKEIHLRISSPPIRFPCYYGIDMPDKKEFIASKKSVEEIRKYLDVDSLGYLSINGLLSVVKKGKEDFCSACFDGEYPVSIE
ncbi:MAG: amidophosphoribosyltransferase [Chitinispirillia bacterium]|jgi:amidophosphoribosyltransferase